MASASSTGGQNCRLWPVQRQLRFAGLPLRGQCTRPVVQRCMSGKGSPPMAAVQLARPYQARRVSVAVAAVAADMGGSHNIGIRASGSWAMPSVLHVLQPSKYDAELLHLAVPALAAMMLEPLMNVLSAAFLGHLGTQQLGAVSLASLAVSLSTYVFSFLVFLTTPRIAAAHANGDSKAVARLAAVGLWLAAVIGLFVAVGLNLSAGAIVSAMKPPEPEVTTYAVQYISVRSWGILAAMLGFVASGTYRGVKDTRTPLSAAIGAALMHVTLTPLFILGLDWGVWGAGLAASISQWVSCLILVSLMFRRQLLQWSDLLQPPRWDEVVPYLWKGAVLALRMIVTFGMIMFASAICVRAGAASQAAFEIIRQVWIISVQFFECLNVATQAMAAAFLGRHDRASARDVLWRALQVSSAAGLAMGLLLFVSQGPLVHLFTKDAAVAVMAGAIMPVIAVCMPLDAGASIMDGGLIAAGQTNALSVIQVVGSLVQYGVLAYLVAHGLDSVVTVWAVLKILTMVRLAAGYWLHFASARSAYLPQNRQEQQQLSLQPKQQQAEEELQAAAAVVTATTSSSNDSSSLRGAAEYSSSASSSSSSIDSVGGFVGERGSVSSNGSSSLPDSSGRDSIESSSTKAASKQL